jgi:hypothetical protein
MILPSMRCSITCADQPDVREMTKERREHRGRHAHHVVARRAVPVEVGEHLLSRAHITSSTRAEMSKSFMFFASFERLRATSLMIWLRGSAMV